MIADEEVDAFRQMMRNEIQRYLGNMKSPFVYATWVAAESGDANLSEVTLAGGTTANFVPKAAHVTGLVAGQTVLCVKGPGVPLTIVARVVGDITTATV